MEPLLVEVCLGHKGEPTPRAFTHEGVRHEVTQVLDRWYRQEMTYFRLAADDGHRYVVRLDEESQRWELVMQEQREGSGVRAKKRGARSEER